MIVIFIILLTTVVCEPSDDFNDINVHGIGTSMTSAFYNRAILNYLTSNSDKKYHPRFTYTVSNGNDGLCHVAEKKGCHQSKYLYGGTNSELTEEEQIQYPNIMAFPVVAGAIVVVYNIPGIRLTLTQNQIAEIFAGRVKNWNDPSMIGTNPGLAIHKSTIKLIARQDTSDATQVFTEMLSRNNDFWRENYETFNSGATNYVMEEGRKFVYSSSWPNDTIYMFAKGTVSMIGMVASIPYSIGYAAITDAMDSGLQIAELFNSKHKLIKRDAIVDGVEEAMRYFVEKQGPVLLTSISNAPTDKAYPMATYSYMIVNGTTPAYVSCKEMTQYFRYVSWFLKTSVPRDIELANSLVPLDPKVIAKVQSDVLNKLSCMGRKVWEISEEEIYNEQLKLRKQKDMIIVQVILLVILFFVIIIGCVIIQRYRMRKTVNMNTWLWEEAEFKIFTKSKISMGSRTTIEFARDTELQNMSKWQKLAKANDQSYVFFAASFRRVPEQFSSRTKKKVVDLISSINDENVMGLAGITEIGGGFNFYFVYRGQDVQWLHFIIQRSHFHLNDQVRLAIAVDAAYGMEYLHSKNIAHTTLNSLNIFVDAKWTVKI